MDGNGRFARSCNRISQYRNRVTSNSNRSHVESFNSLKIRKQPNTKQCSRKESLYCVNVELSVICPVKQYYNSVGMRDLRDLAIAFCNLAFRVKSNSNRSHESFNSLKIRKQLNTKQSSRKESLYYVNVELSLICPCKTVLQQFGDGRFARSCNRISQSRHLALRVWQRSSHATPTLYNIPSRLPLKSITFNKSH